MAGDWIKMRIDLQSHPKVVRILSAMRRTDVHNTTDKFRVIGGLHAVWSVFDTHSTDGALPGYTPELLDHIVGLDGIAQAMIDVDWLLFDGEQTLAMPEFSEHNGKSGKRRAEDQKRKREERKCPQTVRDLSADDEGILWTREEKRREEKDINTIVASIAGNDESAGSDESDSGDKVAKLPACPHQKIIALYAEELPVLAQPRGWEGARATALQARWKFVLTQCRPNGEPYATDLESGLDFFKRLFAYIRTRCPHLVGVNDRQWQADLAWIVKAENFLKILEGKYEKVAA